MANKTNKKRLLSSSREEAIAKIQQIIDEISGEAEQRGLTPEILESLLKDE